MTARDSKGRELCTVDTGELTDVWPGSLVTWLHVPRGGYGYEIPVDAKVVAIPRRPSTKVTIEVVGKTGRVVRRVVDASRLRSRAHMGDS